VQHTSEKEQGQIYLPAVNWGLMVAVMILVLGFKSSNNLAAAYGIAVTGDMVITSILATVVAAKVWGWGWIRAGLLFTCFLAVELVFLTANILKIPDGGWFPLVAGMAVFVLMTTWKRGRQLLSDRLKGERLELALFLDVRAHHTSTNRSRDGFSNLFRARTVARLEIGGDRKWTCRSNGPHAIQHGLPAHSSFLIRESQRESHACTRSGDSGKAAGREHQRTTNVPSVGHQKDGLGSVQLLEP
jgi:hypothetical protein